MNMYRLAHGKHWVKLNDKLNTVAKLHLENLKDSLPANRKAVPHSWFADPKKRWEPFVYYKIKDGAPAIYKAKEITNYNGIAAEVWAGTGDYKPMVWLKAWSTSTGHKNTILQKGNWDDSNWTGVGVSIYNGMAVMEFGNEIK